MNTRCTAKQEDLIKREGIQEGIQRSSPLQSSPKRNCTGGWGYSGVVIAEVTKSSMRSNNTWGWGVGYSGVVIAEVTKSSMRSNNTWGWGVGQRVFRTSEWGNSGIFGNISPTRSRFASQTNKIKSV